MDSKQFGKWALALAGLKIAAMAAFVLVAPAMTSQAQDAASARAAADNLSAAFAQVVDQTSPAVVFVEVEKEVKQGSWGGNLQDDLIERFFGPGTPFGMPPGHPGMPPRNRGPKNYDDEEDQMLPFGQGTGFIVSEDGYIVTNHHVVGDADKVTVKLSDGRKFDATLKGSDAQTEIAVLKVEATGLPVLQLGDSDKLRVGQWVMAIGNPFGLEHTVTAGIVSARGRGTGLTEYADFIQTDAAINPGNSGGPLLNLNGEVVGVNTALYSRSGGYMGVSFAVPVNIVKYIKDQLIEKGTVARGYLGLILQDLNENLSQHFGTDIKKGILVPQVLENGPAGQAGIQPEDIIVELNGQAVEDSGSFKSRVGSTAPGSRVTLGIVRGGQKMNIEVTLGELPKDMEKGENLVAGKSDGTTRIKLGFTVQNLSEDIARDLGFEGQEGIVVTEVTPGSHAQQAGLLDGVLIQEANRTPVRNVDDFNKALHAVSPGGSLLLKVRDREYSRYVSLKVEEK